MTVAELIAMLERFDPQASLVLSTRGHHVSRPVIGVGLDGNKDAVVVLADREQFAGRLPDALLLRVRRYRMKR